MWLILKTTINKVVSTVVRNMLTAFFAYLVGKKWITATEGEQFVAVFGMAISSAIVGIIHHYYTTKTNIAQVEVARQSPSDKSIEDIKREAKVLKKLDGKIEELIKKAEKE